MANDEQTTENHSLYLFLAHQNSITNNLKTELQQINGYCVLVSFPRLFVAHPTHLCRNRRFDDVLTLILNQSARYFEENLFLLPQEKHSLLRVMSYGLFLMDGDNEKLNIFKSKKISLSPFQKSFKVPHPFSLVSCPLSQTVDFIISSRNILLCHSTAICSSRSNRPSNAVHTMMKRLGEQASRTRSSPLNTRFRARSTLSAWNTICMWPNLRL